MNLPPLRLKHTLVVAVLLAVGTLLLYCKVGSHPFIDYDDRDYVFDNAHVKEGVTWDTLTWSLTATEEANWHPLTWMSHALDCQLFGLNAGGHHWTSVVIHALNVVLLFLLLQRATGARWRSFFVAALFAFHPLNVESVAWVAERKNVLSTLFLLLALGAYGWYARKPSVRRYGLVALLFVLGLAAKPMVITLPFVLLLVDFWPLQRIENWSDTSPTFPVPQEPFPRLVLEKLPLLLFSAGSAVITLIAQRETVISTLVLPVTVRLENAVYAYGMYLWKAIWPAHLALIYPHPGRTLPAWQPTLAALTLASIGWIAWRQRSTRPYLAVGLLWFLGTAVPVIGIIQVGVQVIADRYAYLPLIGVFLILVWAAGDGADRLQVSFVPRIAVGFLLLGLLAFVTWRQIGYWRSTIDVWTHALAVTTNNSIAEQNISNAYFSLGRYQEGMVHYRNYSRLEPLDPAAHARVAADFQDHGQLSAAIKEYEAAIRSERVVIASGVRALDSTTLAVTYANMAVIYAQLGEVEHAREQMKNALGSDRQAVEGMMNQLDQSLATRPTAEGYLRFGLFLALTGHPSEAQQAFAFAQRLDPKVGLPPTEGGAQP
ncbi:MAG TPA: tetratricopeptide repeat protein [Candidatus Sulfotelmatobacter sp.]